MPCCPMPGKAPPRLSRTPTSSRAGSRLAAIRSRPAAISAVSASRACMGCSGSPSPMPASSTCATARCRRSRSPPAKAASTATPTGSGATIPLANGTKRRLFPPPTLRDGMGAGARDQARRYRLRARRDPAGIRLATKNAHDWTDRYPSVVAAENALAIFDPLGSRPGGEAQPGTGACRCAIARHVFEPVEVEVLERTCERDPVEDLRGAGLQLVARQILQVRGILVGAGLQD